MEETCWRGRTERKHHGVVKGGDRKHVNTHTHTHTGLKIRGLLRGFPLFAPVFIFSLLPHLTELHLRRSKDLGSPWRLRFVAFFLCCLCSVLTSGLFVPGWLLAHRLDLKAAPGPADSL